jgi:hypothetical protein
MHVLAALVIGGAVASCGVGAARSAATTPAPSAPWKVVTQVETTGALDTPAYVSAEGADLVITAPTRSSESDTSSDSLVARVTPSGARKVGIAPRAIVGVIREPGAPVRVISLRSTTNADARALAVSTLATDGVTLTGTKRFAHHLPSINSAAFAQNAAGDGVLAWSESRVGSEDDGIEQDRLEIRVATGKWGRFGAPRTLRKLRGESASQVPTLAADTNERGRFVVASDVACVAPKLSPCVNAWTGSARTGRVGQAIVTRPPDMVGPLRAVIADDGRVALAWRNSNGDAMEPHGPVDVSATTAAASARSFAPIQRVDRAPEDYPSSTGIELIAPPTGPVTLVLTRPLGGWRAEHGDAVDAMTMNASGRFGARQTIAAKGSAGGVAARAEGDLIVTFVDHTGAATLGARVRLPGAARFGPAEILGPVPPHSGLQPVTSQPRFGIGWISPPDAPVPSFDPSTGQPLVAYTTASSKSATGHVLVLARDRP